MDTDLFQGVLLGLLALGVIVLAALLATLGGIRKALEELRARGADQLGSLATSDAPDPHLTSSTPISAVASTASATTEPTPAASGYGAEPAATAASPGTGQVDTIRSVLQDHGLAGGGEAGYSQQTATPAAAEPAQVDSVFAAHADDPQEEPFQRDGRWWFKRADELLLYDEATGQWQPAPAGALGGQTSAPGATPSQAQTAAPTGGATSTATAAPAVADQVATFWKCPTCGAVNGSTAATCRMCFAARP